MSLQQVQFANKAMKEIEEEHLELALRKSDFYLLPEYESNEKVQQMLRGRPDSEIQKLKEMASQEIEALKSITTEYATTTEPGLRSATGDFHYFAKSALATVMLLESFKDNLSTRLRNK
ncbi:Uncharacterised protein [uncultured archaeon]|nr:Uncharacterised protein [uncultured archaeon]